ncbi:hypothetical protein ACHQM5_026270 [Ranunculus cassubicifolius]
METKNILFLLLLACLSSHLLLAGADCLPRTFRYLLPKEDSLLSDDLAPAPSPESECSPAPSSSVEPSIIVEPTLRSDDDEFNLSLDTSTPDDEHTISLDAPTNSSATADEGLNISLDKPTPDDEPTNPSATPGDKPTNPSTTTNTLKTLLPIDEPTHPSTTTTPGMLENPKLKKICESTGNPLLCFSSLGSLVPKGPLDPVALMQNEIRACKDKAKMVLDQSEKIVADPSTAPDVAEALGYCKENYDSALLNLEEAVNGIATRDVGLMNSMLSAVIADISTCQDTFAEVTTSPNPMAEMGETVSNLASNCLAILDFLHW